MTHLAFYNLIRSNSVKIGLLFLFLTGVISLFIGKQFIQKQKQNIADTAIYQEEHITQNVKFHKDDMGLLLYYLKFSLVNEVPAISGLSIGQRDVNSSIKSVTIRGLEGQKHDTDLNNPYNSLLGSLDFSFVLIFLFPLLIIAFTYNIISEEKESGTWSMVAVQSKSLFKHILKLFLIRIALILAVLLLILFLAIPILGIPINVDFWAIIATSVSYLLVWSGICFWVVSLQRSSNFSAVVLLAVWILLIIILPAAANNYLVNKYPVPEALETTLKQRKGYHEKWDMPKEATMDKFFAHYPQYKKYPVPKDKFSWLWYYGMQQMSDDESLESSKTMKEKIKLREKVSQAISLVIPTMHAQLTFNQIAQSDLNNHILFLDHLDKYHEELRLYFYPKIFENYPVKNENWKEFKPKYASITHTVNWTNSILPLILITVIISLISFFNLRRI
ncbi:ABC-2 type transport system permease protein [Aquimarina sp. MAR_2010_214]|uniref:DUF3526 domain-containing protein n=1 Tax=Aquimarina sp. MAR_2010_214 TaxID=1250026 RepID=UPI000C7031A5|nr:DUF3526 domain-containing protein [Aquimarina sp. MAR_2010_214]PKV50145.1 ABC-2 type transport system permease protein [Aquimarina sp. MAR_2010_214]